jgi:hypothetical protein
MIQSCFFGRVNFVLRLVHKRSQHLYSLTMLQQHKNRHRQRRAKPVRRQLAIDIEAEGGIDNFDRTLADILNNKNEETIRQRDRSLRRQIEILFIHSGSSSQR